MSRAMTKHKFDDCPESGCEYPIRCGWCEGNKSHCTECGLAEGILTTDCPEVMIPGRTQQRVMDNQIDYVEGLWIKVSDET